MTYKKGQGVYYKNATLEEVLDQTTHWLATKDVVLVNCITNNAVAVSNAGLSNLDVSINTLFTSTGIKVSSMPSVTVTNTVLTNIYDQTTHFVGTKDLILNAIEDQTTHFLATKDILLMGCIGSSKVNVAEATIDAAIDNPTYSHYFSVKSQVLAEVEDQLVHFLAVRDTNKVATAAPIIKKFTIAGTDQAPAYTAETSILSGRKMVWFKNVSAGAIQIANASNSPTDSFTLDPSDMIPFPQDPNSTVTYTFKYLGTGTVTDAIQRLEWK